MRNIGIKQLRGLRTEAFKRQTFLLCSDRKPVALIVSIGDLSEEEIATPKGTTEKPYPPDLLKMEPPSFTPLPKVRQSLQPFEDYTSEQIDG